MSDENHESCNMDAYSGYRCDSQIGCPEPWSGHFDFWRSGIQAGDVSLRVSRVGLVVGCSDEDILRRLFSDAELQLIIGDKAYVKLQFSAFWDAAVLHWEDLPPELQGLDRPIFSCSIGLVQPIKVPPRQIAYLQVRMPKQLEDQLKLQERDVFAWLADQQRQVPRWFITIGGRLIGTRTRPIQ